MDLVNRIVVRSEFGPTLDLDLTGEPGVGSALSKMMKPEVSVYVSGLANPLVFAPQGHPGNSKWPWVSAGVALFAALGAYVFMRGLLPRV